MYPRMIIAALALLCLPVGCAREEVRDRIPPRGETLEASGNSSTAGHPNTNASPGFEYALAGSLELLRQVYFGHINDIPTIDSYIFTRNMRKTLPFYRALIQQVANEYQLDWHLLAAIAYQESHWNPQATSPTGVRGMMMLTLPTAGEMGVDNRLDARQSLRGGARYLKNIKRRLPGDIYEPDRTWLTLAAYNIGMAHLEDARVITDRQGGDPHLWQDVMARLPLLQQSKYFESVRHGYARGVEAVTYVQNIRHYYGILVWQGIPGNIAQPPLHTEDHQHTIIHDISYLAL